MNNMFRTIPLVLCLASLTLAAVKLSDLVTPCSIKDPKLNQCITTQTATLIPYLVKGVKEWNILSIDPLVVPHMSIQQVTGGGGLSFNITDCYHRGLKDCSYTDFNFNTKTYELTYKVECPSYNVKGKYEVSGQIILLPIRGNGAADITFQHFVAKMKLILVPETRHKETYLKVQQAESDNSVRGIIFNLENLFGNKALSDNMNAVLTENGVDVFNDLKESLDNSFADIAHQIVERILKKIPLNRLFKEI